MRERPILFSGPMVRAILAGTKTQTRRVVNPQPEPIPADTWKDRGVPADRQFRLPSNVARSMVEVRDMGALCPYGAPGDRLWVRETFWDHDRGDPPPARAIDPEEDERIEYRATPWDRGCAGGTDSEDAGGWTPSIHMPRWASRLTLTITDVRVERLQAISDSDVAAEGVRWQSRKDGSETDYIAEQPVHPAGFFPPRICYWRLWDSLNAARGFGFDANPWVWVLTFTVDKDTGHGR